ncbi:MAG: nucleotidyl transferase AbiEii/AbiGii toxin family protein [Magnetococcus sp. DMHC-1]|nr:nucleotidyl transferase AbiEii/AbiGii toxin family protein [Magnetococcales bacterium]
MIAHNVAASVRARLLNHARDAQQDFNFILTRYALERLLYRISISRHVNLFLLKGALLFDLWFDIPHRPTRDADFLGFGSSDLHHMEEIFREICAIEAKDGMAFQPDTVRATDIRKNANHAGVRVTLLGLLDHARCQVQIDIGFGDVVTPAPEDAEYPVILTGFEVPRLRVYPRYTVVAEKTEALTSLGIANSRMKDYFDLWILAQQTEFDGNLLCQAIRATFNCRGTALQNQLPFGITQAFAHDRQKQMLWKAFLRKNRLTVRPLDEVVSVLANFLSPVMQAASNETTFSSHWVAGGPWISDSH